jgi:hypothetical protein
MADGSKIDDAYARYTAARTAAINVEQQASNASDGIVLWSPDLVRFLSVSVLLFTFLALLLSAVLLWRQKSPGTSVLRIFGIITIIGMSAVLLVVGYSNSQLTPIIGLFGAIAGYLLGRDTRLDLLDAGQTVHVGQADESDAGHGPPPARPGAGGSSPPAPTPGPTPAPASPQVGATSLPGSDDTASGSAKKPDV